MTDPRLRLGSAPESESGALGSPRHLHVAAGEAGATVLGRPKHRTDSASEVPTRGDTALS